jgi:hypothetical protein
MEVMKLWDRVTWWVKFNKFLKKRVWLVLWMEKGVQIFFPKLEAKAFMDSRYNNCIVIVKWG